MFAEDPENAGTYVPVTLPTLTLLERTGTRAVYALPGHTIAAPKVLVCKTSTGNGKKAIARASVQAVFSTSDNQGLPLNERVIMKLEAAFPMKGQLGDMAAALYAMKEVMGSEGYQIDTLITDHTPLG